MKLVVATGNAHKVEELGQLLAPADVSLASYTQATGTAFQVEETGDTFEANALLKARHAAEQTGLPSLGDDSGLEVDALGGAPGVYSTRYAGPGSTDADNNARLIRELAASGQSEPYAARFVCVLALAWPGDLRPAIIVRGECEGAVSVEPRGDHGFGYDPYFVPRGSDRAMAEMSETEKNAISHRGHAAAAMLSALKGLG